MKKSSFFKKASFLFASVLMTAALFAGCSSSKTSKDASSSKPKKSFNSSQMKTRLKSSIDSLVKDGTITQSQEDQIVTALSSGFGQRRQNQNNNSGSGSNNQNGNQNNNGGQNGQQKGNFQNGGHNFQNSALSKLVTDKVITQAQADKVTQAMSSNMRPNRNGQGAGQNQDNQNSNSGNQN